MDLFAGANPSTKRVSLQTNQLCQTSVMCVMLLCIALTDIGFSALGQ